MNVLLTGAFGNIGESTLLALQGRGHSILCFDIKTDRNAKYEKKLSETLDFETSWGDLSENESLEHLVKGVDAIVHLSAMTPPHSETKADIAREVNVEGTRRFIDAAKKEGNSPKFIFTSSVSIYGPRGPQSPPVTADTPIQPTTNYTHHKVESEKIVRESNLPWTILRLGMIPSLELTTETEMDIFQIPLDQRIHFGHTRDVGVAIANCIEADTDGKTLLIAGDKSCEMLNGVFTNRLMETMGIGSLPEEAFKVPVKDDDWFFTDWMDTEESQRILKYQTRTYDDYLEDMKQALGGRRAFMRLIRPFVRRMILKQSDYLHKN
ncbi:MAG: NAD-dependent epimerase/dehydratase family protein [Candidatus Thorarchaeota archaeon]|jgi:nucleoside-diphosphate-sugar epimerase